MSWEVVIGLEIHTHLLTKSKIFSGAATTFGAAPNTQACIIDLAMPGVLPVLNRQAVVLAIKFGHAIQAHISPRSVFARKNYFYPDLPKGYQISQFELPIVGRGQVEITLHDGSTKSIGITRAHLEEDAGKSLHEDYHGLTGIDLNRAGASLLEIVSEPDMRSPQEASAYARKIHQILQYLNISDGNMQEGSFRMDANVSIRPKGTTKLGTRAELKNINSFKFLEKAIEFEIERQINVIETGNQVIQETRLYDPERNETRSMRSKEEANDYRYFPDPDLLPLELNAAFIAEAIADLPELPEVRKLRIHQQYGLSKYDAEQLTSNKALADYFEQAVAVCTDAKLVANWITGELTAALHRDNKDIHSCPITAQTFGQLLLRIVDKTLSGKTAKTVFDAVWNKEGEVDQIIAVRGLRQITDINAIEQAVEKVIAANPLQVQQFLAGKDKVLGFLVGQVMQTTKGKANPQQVNTVLQQKLGKS
jgi:aspartyl-tRNA(Asn)/glutamyl-tRNA(Gln) amidotransferase subunit B